MRNRPLVLKMVVLLSSIVLLSEAWSQEFPPDAILGTWSIEEEGEPVQHIEIYTCGEQYCGKIAWLREPKINGRPRLDEKNKDKSLRNRPLLGLKVLSGYTHEQGDTWSGGELYAFEKGRVISPKLRLIDEDQLEVRVRFLLFNKTFVWKRLLQEG